MRPARGLLLVRPVEAADTFAGGRIVVPDVAKQRLTAHQAEVVAVGDSEVCEDEECEREHQYVLHDSLTSLHDAVHCCPVAAGDWILVRPRSFLDSDAPERRVWFVRQRDVLAIVRRDDKS